MTIVIMAMILVLGVAQLIGLSPQAIIISLSSVRQSLSSAPTPVLDNSPVPSVEGNAAAVIPHYPPVKITVPPSSPFAADTAPL